MNKMDKKYAKEDHNAVKLKEGLKLHAIHSLFVHYYSS
jgi:hypothetical protein